MRVTRAFARRPRALGALIVAVVVLSAALLAIGVQMPKATGVTGPKLMVLGGAGRTSTVWTVDLRRRRPVAHADLRSFAISADLDGAGRLVTAQCGGLGQQADDVLGVVGDQGRVEYVGLPVPNPSAVAVLGSRAFVMHGFETREGLCVTSVDLEKKSVEGTGAVGGLPQRIDALGGRVLLARGSEGEGSVEICELDPATLSAITLGRVPLAYAAPVVGSDFSGSADVSFVGFRDGGTREQRAESSLFVGFDTRTGRVTRVHRLTGMKAGAFGAATDADTLAVIDASGAEPSVEDAVALFDASTGSPRARLTGLEPLAVIIVDHEVVVADASTRSLRHFDESGRPLGSTPLGELGSVAVMRVVP